MLFTDTPWRYRIGTVALAIALTYPGFSMAKYPYWSDKKPRPERTVIITRALSDLGKSTTYHFATRKCRVIMGCENLEECRAVRRQMIVDTNNRSLVCRQLDMEDIGSINKFVDEISVSEPHVDVLVNNTTYRGKDKQKITKYGVEKHFLQNFLGPYLLTLRLLPKLEESAEHQRDSRIVFHVEKPKRGWRIKLDDLNFEKKTYKDERAYAQSQLATAYFAITLNKRLREQRSKVLVFANGSKAKNLATTIFDEKETGFWEYVTNFLTTSPVTLTHLSVKLGLDETLSTKDSGKLFTYIFLPWGKNNGWGRPSETDPIATVLWNFAADLLVNLPEAKKTK